MKRIWFPGILVCALLLGHSSRPSRAYQKQTTKAATWEEVTFNLETGKKESVMVLKIWDSAAGDLKWPQLALLRITPAVYKELRKDSKALKAFIDGSENQKPVFDAPVNITEGCNLPEPENEKSAGDVGWLVLVSHRTSLCSCTALREYAIAH